MQKNNETNNTHEIHRQYGDVIGHYAGTEWIMEKEALKYKTRFIQHVDQEERNRLSKLQKKCTTSG